MLFNKIVLAKKLRHPKREDAFVPTLKGKWAQEDARIINENKKMVDRVIHQKTCLKTWQGWSVPRQSPRRLVDKNFYESRLK